MKISKRAIAKEWLIFLLCYFVALTALIIDLVVNKYAFEPTVFIAPLIFYGIVCFVRSIIWSIKTVKKPATNQEVQALSKGTEVNLNSRKDSSLAMLKNKILALSAFELPPKFALWFSIIVTTISALWFAKGFIAASNSNLTPVEQGEISYRMTNGLIKIGLAVIVVTWGIKGKLEKFFAASVVLGLITIYSMLVAKH